MTGELDHVWQQIQGALLERVGERTYGLWLAPLRCVSLEGDTLVLEGPPEVSAWASTRLADALQSAAATVLGATVEISIAGCGSVAPARPVARAAAPAALNPKYTFEQFVIGPSNRLAHAAALSVAEMPSQAYNPLFIYGPPGLGKTHLLHAVGNYVGSFGGGLTVRYATAEEFTNAFLAALARRDLDDFKEHFRGVDVLLIDDVQFLERKARSEEELFHTFNALYDAGSQLVITCDRLPGDLGDLEDRLRERFAAGLVTDIERPDPATRLAILRKRAAHDGVVASDDALALLAARVTTNVRALEGALIRMVAYGSLSGRALDATLAAEVLDRLGVALTTTRADHDRGGADSRLLALRPDARGAPLAVQSRAGALAAPGGHVPLQGAHDALAADNRTGVRRPRPHNRSTRLQARRRAHRRLAACVRRHRSAHRDADRPGMSLAVAQHAHTLSTHAVPGACEHWPDIHIPTAPTTTTRK